MHFIECSLELQNDCAWYYLSNHQMCFKIIWKPTNNLFFQSESDRIEIKCRTSWSARPVALC